MIILKKISKLALGGVFFFMIIACSDQQEKNNSSDETVEKPLKESLNNEKNDIIKPPSESFLNYDMVMGDKDAPIEVIEYAAFTCGHCRQFHAEMLPALKKDFFDTGKVKLVFRSFLLNPFDIAPTALSRCVPEGKFFPIVKKLFETQGHWLSKEDYIAEAKSKNEKPNGEGFSNFSTKRLLELAKQFKLDANKIQKCMQGEKLKQYMMSVVQYGIDHYKISATPTVLINKKVVKLRSVQDLRDEIEKNLKKIQ